MSRKLKLIAFGAFVTCAAAGLLIQAAIVGHPGTWTKASVVSSGWRQWSLSGTATTATQSEMSPTPEVKSARSPVQYEDQYVGKLVADTDKHLTSESIPMRVRIGKDVDQLRSETVRDSLLLLSEIEMFCWPGSDSDGGTSIIGVPISREVGQADVAAVLSNRRFLKLLKELSEMSQEEATKMVAGEIDKSLPQYVSLFESEWKSVKEVRQANPIGPAALLAGPTLRLSNNEDHSPTLAGARYKIFGLLLLAGNLQLKDTRAAVQKVLAEALRQRKRMYEETEASESDRVLMLQTSSLYNRQILATALLQLGISEVREKESAWQTHDLPLFDALFTPYDLLTRHGGPLSADYSRGKKVIRVHAPLEDAEFDKISGKLL